MSIIDYLILILIILCPILILICSRKYHGIKKWGCVTLINLILLLLLVCLWAWWDDKSSMIRLSNYGYDYDAMTYYDRFKNVAVENMEEVERLETSIMGVGWQVKAFFGFITLIIYLLIVYLINIFIYIIKKAKKQADLTLTKSERAESPSEK